MSLFYLININFAMRTTRIFSSFLKIMENGNLNAQERTQKEEKFRVLLLFLKCNSKLIFDVFVFTTSIQDILQVLFIDLINRNLKIFSKNQLNNLNSFKRFQFFKKTKYEGYISSSKKHSNFFVIAAKNNNSTSAFISIVCRYTQFIHLFLLCLKLFSVFDLNTFQFIKHDTLPTYNKISYHCFISKSENGQVQEMMKTNQKYKQNYQMLLFCAKIGLSIEYDEDNNNFQFHKLSVRHDIALFKYVYVCINDIILFFGELDYPNTSKSVFNPLFDCVAILNEEDNYIHIIGGYTYMKTKVRGWDPSQLSKNEIKLIIKYWTRTLKIKLGWINDFDKIIMKQYIK
ncbi:hypothetical protein RFI_05470 [Reticulomyxa filosa]|uniref:Uncharacterized protein n=1 Tax=Reticulomyxa filosa TaxID=46433 RepID=X6P0P5_RETFI|nr:hypothetical protein RFI_05470 [Reticulomyxa filosa]|eukprot:ETO31649.1 hypothetical protein RFI_05470 [Reticulomyxa filosa]